MLSSISVCGMLSLTRNHACSALKWVLNSLSEMQIDLLPSTEAISAVEHAIHTHNAEVGIIRTTKCSLDISEILNRNAFVGSSQPPSLQALTVDQTTDSPNPQATSDHDHKLTVSSSASAKADAAQTHKAGQHQHLELDHDQHNHDAYAHHSHSHDNAVRSVSISCPGEVELERSACINAQFASMLSPASTP